jgi:hypothetical protein
MCLFAHGSICTWGLFAHVKQQPIVDVIDPNCKNNNNRANNEIFIAVNILKQENEMNYSDNHEEKIKHGNKMENRTIFFVHWRE